MILTTRKLGPASMRLRLDRSGPFANGLGFAMFAHRTQEIPADLVTGRQALLTADGKLPNEPTPKGLGIQGLVTDVSGSDIRGYNFGNDGGFVPTGGPMTWAAMYVAKAATLGSGASVLSYGNSNTGCYMFRSNNNNDRVIVYGASQAVVTGAAHVTGQVRLVVGRADGSRISIWSNGVKTAETSSTVLPGANAAGLRVAMCGTSALVLFAAVWARALTDSQIVLLSRNPYQLLQPGRMFVGREGAAAAFHARPYYDMTTHHGISGAGV